MLDNIANVRFLQRLNREKVLAHIRKNSPVSRAELAKATGLSLSSITNIVSYLIDSNLVTECGVIKSAGAGRKATKLFFNAAAMQIVAINIEINEATISITDLAGGVLKEKSLALSPKDDAEKTLSTIEEKLREILKENKSVKAIAFAVSGHVSSDGKVSSSTMRWDRIDVKGRFEKATGLCVYVSNNTKTKGLWTIRALNDQKHNNIVFLDMSSEGVGIINAYGGEINNAVAGEFGHTIITGGEHKCFCGNVGCLESVCNVSYIELQYKELSGEAASIYEIKKRAESGNKIARQVIDKACGYMSAAIINIIMIFEPDLIIVNASELFEIDALYNEALDRAVAHSSKLAMKKPDFKKVDIASSQSAQGAAQIAADELLGINAPDDIL